MYLFAALAEFERELGRERTHAGLKAARARGAATAVRVHSAPIRWRWSALCTTRASTR